MEIIPAVIGQSFGEIEPKLKLLEGVANWVHLDVTDGTLTRGSSWSNPDDIEFVDGKLKLEVHLMVRQPEEIFGDWSLVADRVLVHGETALDPEALIAFAGRERVELGVVLNLETPISELENYGQELRLVQLMAIGEIGEQGHVFEDKMLDKIKLLREIRPNVKIQVDGGINLKTARLAFAAGADNLVVGSAIWQTPDPLATLKLFQKLN
ncbi:MAG: hypothetical protein AAB455_02135 [Patescibacteria group bacterium]